MSFPLKFKSLEADFDLIELQQDNLAFTQWAASLRDTDPEELFRTSDAVVSELAAFTLQRSMLRSLPTGFTWKLEIEPDRCRLQVHSPSGKHWSFSDDWFGVIMYTLESTDFQRAEVPQEPDAPAAKPFLFSEVQQDDPFERARAEMLLKRMAS